MIVVIGRSTAREGADEMMQRLAVEHVARSRSEPGCISYEVSRDIQQPRSFVFIERWTDISALQSHFRVEASRQFANSMAALSDEKPVMSIYRTEVVEFSAVGAA